MADELVTIRNFAYGPDPVSRAELARLDLEAADIPCFLAGREFAAMNWLYSGATRGVKLQVRACDVEKAREVLGARPALPADRDCAARPAEEPEIATCPHCDGEDVEYERFSRRFFYVSLLLFGFPLLWATRRWRCLSCGHRWRAGGRQGRRRADGET
jgi:hypothetical protein